MRTSFSVAALICVLAAQSGAVMAQDDLLERGTYLAEGIVACGNCHTPKAPDATPIAEMKLAGARR